MAGGLETVVDMGGLPQSHFLAHGPNGALRCNLCHAQDQKTLGLESPDIPESDVASVLAQRRSAVIDRLNTAVAALWATP